MRLELVQSWEVIGLFSIPSLWRSQKLIYLSTHFLQTLSLPILLLWRDLIDVIWGLGCRELATVLLNWLGHLKAIVLLMLHIHKRYLFLHSKIVFGFIQAIFKGLSALLLALELFVSLLAICWYLDDDRLNFLFDFRSLNLSLKLFLLLAAWVDCTYCYFVVILNTGIIIATIIILSFNVYLMMDYIYSLGRIVFAWTVAVRFIFAQAAGASAFQLAPRNVITWIRMVGMMSQLLERQMVELEVLMMVIHCLAHLVHKGVREKATKLRMSSR